MTRTLPLTSADAKVIENMPFSEYAAVDALNGSSIINMRRSPLFYKFMKDNPPAPTEALIIGTYIHRLILEPGRMGEFVMWENGKRAGKAWEAFKEENGRRGDLAIVTETQAQQLIGMVTAARKHLPIRKYADAKGPTELSLFWTDSVSGRPMKCRLDKWIPATRTVADLKSARSCVARIFATQAFQLGYHIKMAIQWSGIRACMGVDPRLKLMVVESKAPHESAVFRITKDILLMGLEEADVLIKRIIECEKRNHWPAELDAETDLPLPSWINPAGAEDDFGLEGLEL